MLVCWCRPAQLLAGDPVKEEAQDKAEVFIMVVERSTGAGGVVAEADGGAGGVGGRHRDCCNTSENEAAGAGVEDTNTLFLALGLLHSEGRRKRNQYTS